MTLRALVLSSLVLGACATTPPPPTQPAAGTQTAAAAANTPPAAVSPVTVKETDTELARWAKSQGYRHTMVGERFVWCKKEAGIGSRIEKETCASDETLATMRSIDEQNKQHLLRSTTTCPAPCGGMPR